MVDALASFNDAAAGPLLLSYWRTYQPAARAAALEALLNTGERASLLLDAIDRHEIPAASLEVAARNRLLEYPDPKVASRAKGCCKRPAGTGPKWLPPIATCST